MHEYSVASTAVNSILKTAQNKKAKRINSVEILLGELSLVSSEQLLFWIKELLSSKDISKDTKIDLRQESAFIKCQKCDYSGNLKPKDANHYYPIFSCPSCESSDIEIEKGRDCILSRIQLEI